MKKLISLCTLALAIFVLIFTDLRIEKTAEQKENELNKMNREKEISLDDTKILTYEASNYINIDYDAYNIEERYGVPEGYQRTDVEPHSFADYLRKKKLKSYGYKALYYNGRVKGNKNIYDSVFDYDIPKQNLHQAADSVMFLRAEYLFNEGYYNNICFSFVNGFKAEYSKWMAGYRIKVRDNEASYHKCYEQICTYDDFLKYMNMIYAYCSSLSLQRDMTQIKLDDMQIGDVFLSSVDNGHVAIVVDMAINYETGEKIFMLAQSGTPAQQTQIIINPTDASISPWYSINFGDELITPEWIFAANNLMRFK